MQYKSSFMKKKELKKHTVNLISDCQETKALVHRNLCQQLKDDLIFDSLTWQTFAKQTKDDIESILLMDISKKTIFDKSFLNILKKALEKHPVVFLADSNQVMFCYDTLAQGVQDYLFLHEVQDISFSRKLLNASQRHKKMKHDCTLKQPIPMQKQLIAFLEKGNYGTVFHDENGTVWYANTIALDILGKSDAELKKIPFCFRQNEENGSEYQITHKTGVQKHIFVRTVQHDWDGKKGHLTTIYDTTESHRIESEKNMLSKQLCRVQKMETIGMLASGIAHDFNNIMSITMMASSNASRLVKDPKLLQDLQVIQDAAERGTSITRQLLAFSRSNETQKMPVNMYDVVKQLYKMLNHSLSKEIELSLNCNEKEVYVFADSGQLYQVMLNMAINAKDAMPKGGKLEISLYQSETQTHNQEVFVTIKDTGSGIPFEIQEHIFNAFFSTKSADKGTGLGLSMAKQIVDDHDGQIYLKSSPGKGSSFTIALPKITSGKVKFAEKENEIFVGHEERILLVEDEASLRGILSKALNEFGYRVYEAENGFEGLETYKKHAKDIDLVISDFGMPKMNGQTLHKKIKQLDSEIKMIIASGYLEQELKQELLENGVNEFIYKPFNIRAILKTIHKVLTNRMAA